MKKSTITCILSVTLTLGSLSTYGQSDVETEPMRKFGLGLHVEQLKMHELMSSYFIPVNKLIFTISPSNKFRLEPSIGFSKAKDESSNGGYTSAENLSGIYFGIGGFGMYQVGKTNLYFGLRIEQGIMKEESNYSGTGYSETDANEIKRFMIGPTIGAEFFFADRFSFGGEFSLKNYSSKAERSTSYDPGNVFETKSNLFSTETGLLLRFYF